MTTRIYVVTVKVDNDLPDAPLFPFLDMLDPTAIVEMDEENVYSIITNRDIDRLLDQTDSVVEYDCGEFTWDWSERVWCLSGTDGGNGWETDDYQADSEEQARLDAIQYLLEYNRPILEEPEW